jgi:hypothetical protein
MGFSADQLAAQLPVVLVFRRRGTHDRPDLRLAVEPPNEHGHKLDGVKPVGLGPALATVDLDAGPVDDDVHDVLGQDEAMDPEAVPSGFVTGDHLRLLGQAESHLDGHDLGQQHTEVPGPDRPESWLLSGSDR